ncbi:hypothetical protein DPMN_000847 [Dreissena polymorpha]|uniref:Uncharacterized protein n=1 Tax=Dreissena polymorpha TaxID=45954 RepID=A0A9D4MHF3_DREPO|nr:hypothetical protein DPMN_000847 [Dreissena polymorpha]
MERRTEEGRTLGYQPYHGKTGRYINAKIAYRRTSRAWENMNNQPENIRRDAVKAVKPKRIAFTKTITSYRECPNYL